MKLAPQHIPGTPQHKLNSLLGRELTPTYTPVCPWPADCTVQWGNGIIPATPFFEAFPTGTFIRGEGESIAAAEQQAFNQYQATLQCDHQWGRTRKTPKRLMPYTNGMGWCRKCGASRSKMFKPIFEIGSHRKPLKHWENEHLDSLVEDEELNNHMDAKYPHMRRERLRHQRLLTIRRKLFGVLPKP